MDQAAAGGVKLSCRNVWKIYGPNPGQFKLDGADSAEAARAIRRHAMGMVFQNFGCCRI